MEGYIKSLSTNWKHIFKRAIRPGGKIPLQELYDSYGKKHGINEGDDFITWLKTIKLKGQLDEWSFSFFDEKAPTELTADLNLEEDDAGVTPDVFSRKKMTVEDVVNLPVRKAREIVPQISDGRLLKYALQEARPRANKDSLCRILEKRLQQLRIDTRR